MGVTRVVSDVYKIDAAINNVYSLLSDFNRIGSLVEVAKQMGMAKDERLSQFSDKIDNIRFTSDGCYFTLKGLGDTGVMIVERVSPTLIKLSGDGRLPFEFFVWIQLLENGPYDTRLKITIEADLNLVMKMMLKGKLEKGVNQFAEALTRIPYGMIG